jgi:hypothetical protein
MPSTDQNLRKMARVILLIGLHTGDQFSVHDHQGRLTRHDICALAWVVAEDQIAPPVFFTDEVASLALIEASQPAMAAIRTLSESLDSEPCETNGQPDYIEHVSNWSATPAVGQTQPPTVSEVIGRILRAAAQATPNAA